jgi:hypothetical protein
MVVEAMTGNRVIGGAKNCREPKRSKPVEISNSGGSDFISGNLAFFRRWVTERERNQTKVNNIRVTTDDDPWVADDWQYRCEQFSDSIGRVWTPEATLHQTAVMHHAQLVCVGENDLYP